MENLVKKIVYINPRYLHVHDKQQFSTTTLVQLSAKIATIKAMTPIVIDGDCLGVVAGTELFLASKMLKLPKVPVVIYQNLTCGEFDFLLGQIVDFIKAPQKFRLNVIQNAKTVTPENIIKREQ